MKSVSDCSATGTVSEVLDMLENRRNGYKKLYIENWRGEMASIEKLRAMHGCSACKHASTGVSGSQIMPALSEAQNAARLEAEAWAYCVKLERPVSSDDGRNCDHYYPDNEDLLKY